MATTPTVTEVAETAWSASPASVNSGSITYATGDLIVILGGTGDAASTLSISKSAGTATLSTFTQQQVITTASSVYASIWTATVTAGGTATITLTKSAGTNFIGGSFFKVTAASTAGLGASAKATVATGAPTLTFSTLADNSAVIVFNGDWNAADGTTRAWRTGAGALTETTYFRDAANWTVYAGIHADAGLAGSKTVGLSAPTGQKYSLVAIEIKGVAGATQQEASGTAAISTTPAGSATARAVAAGTAPITIAAIASTAARTAAAGTAPIATSAGGAAAAQTQASSTAAVSVAATGTATAIGQLQATGAAGIALGTTATATARAVATGTATLSTTASGAATAAIWTAGAATISTGAAGAAAARSVAAAATTLTVAATASPAASLAASGTASLAVSASGIATVPGQASATGTAPVSIGATGTASARAAATGTATILLTATGAAAARLPATGITSTSTTATAAGTVTANATATIPVTFAAAGGPAVRLLSAASVSTTITATGTATVPAGSVQATGSVTITFAAFLSAGQAAGGPVEGSSRATYGESSNAVTHTDSACTTVFVEGGNGAIATIE